MKHPLDEKDILTPNTATRIGVGDRVTIVNRFGQERTGRAVMRGPAGWVLNMGGPHGTPGIATDENVIAIRKARTRSAL